MSVSTDELFRKNLAGSRYILPQDPRSFLTKKIDKKMYIVTLAWRINKQQTKQILRQRRNLPYLSLDTYATYAY